MNWSESSEFVFNSLRLRTQPLGVTFLDNELNFPKVKRPSKTLGHKITICQAVTIARNYGWSVGLTVEDLICVPAILSFGMARYGDQKESLSGLFCDVTFAKDSVSANLQTEAMNLFSPGECSAILLQPLSQVSSNPDVVVIYSNPAQVARMAQAWSYGSGARIPGNFSGKVECTEYLIAPFKTGKPRISIPGLGDRIFSSTQDDELVFSIPGNSWAELLEGLDKAGKKLGARYPIPSYQKFQPEFPPQYGELAAKLKLF
jgi:uncharacterized protein (DUF169 family)